jgi:hypothetical protein
MKIQQPDRELQQDDAELKETPNQSREKQSPRPKKQNITASNWTKVVRRAATLIAPPEGEATS